MLLHKHRLLAIAMSVALVKELLTRIDSRDFDRAIEPLKDSPDLSVVDEDGNTALCTSPPKGQLFVLIHPWESWWKIS